MKTLNRKKPFGEVWGGNSPARFHQDGAYFDHEGKEVQLPAAPETAQAETVVAAAAADPAAAALAERRSALLLQAIPLLEPAADKVIAELDDHDADLLAVMLEVEGMAKKRKTVLEALGNAITAKAQLAAQDAAANALPAEPVDQLNAQIHG